MNPLNDRLRSFLGIDVWHKLGYTGSRCVVGNAEDGAKAGKYEHAYQTYSVIKEVAPDCEVLYLPAHGTHNETYMSEQIKTMIERGVCVWTSSILYGYYDTRIEKAFEPIKDFCTMLIAIGNDNTKDFAKLSRASLVYGVGAGMLPVGKNEVWPEDFSSTTEHVDFVSLDRWDINDVQCVGTSFAAPALAGLCALVNDLFIDKTGKPLTSEMMYLFLKDNAHDMLDAGKDFKTGWGYVTLPSPDQINIGRYTMQDKELETKVAAASEWARDSWRRAILAEITDGTNPQGSITREQVVVMLDRLGVIR